MPTNSLCTKREEQIKNFFIPISESKKWLQKILYESPILSKYEYDLFQCTLLCLINMILEEMRKNFLELILNPNSQGWPKYTHE